jgi:hypothetical protein
MSNVEVTHSEYEDEKDGNQTDTGQRDVRTAGRLLTTSARVVNELG